MILCWSGASSPHVLRLLVCTLVLVLSSVFASIWLLMGREATRRRYGLRQDVAYSRRQGVASHRSRMSLHAFLPIRKPPPCLPYRCLVVPRRPVIGLHRDGLYTRAGDGTRTRDSLLGRQELYQTELLPLGMLVVGVRGLEPRTSRSQTMRATNCATPRKRAF